VSSPATVQNRLEQADHLPVASLARLPAGAGSAPPGASLSRPSGVPRAARRRNGHPRDGSREPPPPARAALGETSGG
jgi:hypothetical protein